MSALCWFEKETHRLCLTSSSLHYKSTHRPAAHQLSPTSLAVCLLQAQEASLRHPSARKRHPVHTPSRLSRLSENSQSRIWIPSRLRVQRRFRQDGRGEKFLSRNHCWICHSGQEAADQSYRIVYPPLCLPPLEVLISVYSWASPQYVCCYKLTGPHLCCFPALVSFLKCTSPPGFGVF